MTVPVHPFFVHFPVALLLASWLFDLCGRLTGRESFRQAGFYSLALGVVGGVLAVFSGLRAADRVANRAIETMSSERAQEVLDAIAAHQTAALVALGMFVILLIWRIRANNALTPRAFNSYLALGALAAIVLLNAGLLGGQMAHGRREPNGDRPAEVIGPARDGGPDPGGPGEMVLP